jgi:hypothetical protein
VTLEQRTEIRRQVEQARAAPRPTGVGPWSLADYLRRRKTEPLDPKKKGKKGVDR